MSVLEDAAVVQLLLVANVATFDDDGDDVFIPHILKLLLTCKRVDIVANSIKNSTREKRGKDIKRNVGQTKSLSNWLDFFHDPSQKL